MTRHFPSTVVILMTLLIGISCSSEHKSAAILDAIPAEAASIRFVNIPLAAKAGVDMSAYPNINSCKGMDIIAITSFGDGSKIIIGDSPVADSIAASGFIPVESSDASYQSFANEDGRSLIVNTEKSLAYLTSLPPVRALEHVKKMEKDADRSSMSSFKGIANYVEKAADDSPVYGAVARRTFGNYSPDTKAPQTEQWLTFSSSGDASEAHVTATLMEGSGKPVEIKGLQTIDTDFLRYLPASFNIVCAVGLKPEMDWDAALSMLSLLPPGEFSSNMAMIMPYLKDLDGTLAMGMAMSPDKSGSYTAFVMARLDRDKINELIDKASALAAMAGISVTEASGDMKIITVPGLGNLYFGELDGNLAISTFPLEAGQSNELTPVFQGHDAAAVVYIPANTSVFGTGSFDRDGRAQLALDGPEATLRLSLAEGEHTAFETFFSMIVR